MAGLLPFPSNDWIVSYLAQHPETRDQDKKAVGAVADFFAHRDITHISLNAGVALAQYNAKQKNQLPLERIAAMQSKFANALKDCKERKPIPTTKVVAPKRPIDDVQLTRRLDAIAIIVAVRLEKQLTRNEIPGNTPSQIVLFQSQEKIVSYLAKHPQTSALSRKNKDLIESVAHFFGGEPLDDYLVANVKTALTLFETNLEIKPHPQAMAKIHTQLVAALRDCAEGKPIPLAKI